MVTSDLLLFPINDSFERSVKAAALYTINSRTVTQIICHPYQSLHIELLYLLPAGSPLYLGNITMNLSSVSA